ncbi:solute carrier family 46 member 3-like [Oppia nitens]|uniref:solute carrier family 46 member 3-like n=1 Tax=Oppia nitens TaxID=1686743 RepID=UPI0023D98D63|nr:solute carrier family 46 member 3-like [Oppia nitens]
MSITSSISGYRWTQLIRELKVEPFLFLYMFSYSLSSMAVSQLVQDKLCRLRYEQQPQYCVEINSPEYDHSADEIKSAILTDSGFIVLYRMIISTIPCAIWSLFIGSWSDKYIHGRKLIMVFGAFGAVIESIALIINAAVFTSDVYLILLSFIPSALFGGIIATLMSTYAYCSATSDRSTRAIRFACLEVSFWLPQPLGSFIGGQILGDGDDKNVNQLYHYIAVFIVSLCGQLAALGWVLIVVNEQPKEPEVQIVNSDLFEASSVTDQSIDSDVMIKSTESITDAIVKHLRELFDISNVIDIFHTCCKHRSHKVRAQIWLLFISIFCVMLSYMGSMIILWQYVEKLFSWSAKKYSNVNSLVTIFTIVSMAIIIPVFMKRYKVRDMLLAIIGVVSLFMQCLMRGSLQRPIGLYLSFIVGMFAPITMIAIRSRLSKIIHEDEVGKVFSLMATVEAIAPTLASVYYSSVFGASIDTYPGLAFQIAAGILLIPLGIFIWIDLYCRPK